MGHFLLVVLWNGGSISSHFREVVYEKSTIGTKNDLDLCLEVVSGHVTHCVTFDVEYLGNRQR